MIGELRARDQDKAEDLQPFRRATVPPLQMTAVREAFLASSSRNLPTPEGVQAEEEFLQAGEG
jgi:hypothetical protein